jgi:hypothetical protein
LHNGSGSSAIFAAIRRASSLVSRLAADRRPGPPHNRHTRAFARRRPSRQGRLPVRHIILVVSGSFFAVTNTELHCPPITWQLVAVFQSPRCRIKNRKSPRVHRGFKRRHEGEGLGAPPSDATTRSVRFRSPAPQSSSASRLTADAFGFLTFRSGQASLAALKRYLTAKPARLAEGYRAIPLVPQALDAFGVTTDCLRPRLISG